MFLRKKKKLSDERLDKILETYAKANTGKYGSDEEMINYLKEHFNKREEKKISVKQKCR